MLNLVYVIRNVDCAVAYTSLEVRKVMQTKDNISTYTLILAREPMR